VLRLAAFSCLLAIAGARGSAPPGIPDASLEVWTAATSASVEGPILAVAVLPGERLALLTREAVRVFRWRNGELASLGERVLDELEPVRSPGGLLLASEDALWVLRSGRARAVLLAFDEAGRLRERVQSDAIPWPSCPHGLRYRAGTNLLEGEAEGLGDGPFLAVAGGLAVDAAGRLLVATSGGPRPSTLRAGPSLVSLGNGLFAAASAAAPGPRDTVLLLQRDGDELRLLSEIPVEGAVRALAAVPMDGMARLEAAVESGDRVRLVTFEIRRGSP
jgi:hypothetical protein